MQHLLKYEDIVMKKIVCGLLIFLIQTTSIVYAKENVKILNASFSEETPNPKTAKAVLSMVEYSDKFALNYSYVWGKDNKKPKWITVNLAITNGKKKLSIPLSAYCDLVDVENIKLNRKNNQYILYIYGGETSTSYTAELVFDSYLREKIVRDNEFPDDAWDETVYHVNELDI